MKEYITENFKKSFIELSKILYSAPILFTLKANGDLWFYINYWGLNAIMKCNCYPILLINEMLVWVLGCKYMTCVNIITAFNKLQMHSDSENLTIFITSLSAFKYKVLPFSLTNGPAFYQQYMNEVLFDFLNCFVQVYFNDILIYSKTCREHVNHVCSVLGRLWEAGLQADIWKCKFHVQKTKFLELILTTEKLKMNSEKIKAIRNWPMSNNLKLTQSFLKFCNFYKCFIYHFFNLAKLLNKLTKKDQLFKWTFRCQDSFESLKDALFKAPVLAHFDPDRKTVLETNASQYITGGVLSQYGDNGSLHPVAFYSKNILSAECNYHIYDKELLAIIKCLENWRPELKMTHNPFEVLTDNQALKHFKTVQKLFPRQCHYLNLISDFNFHIKYCPGKANVKANALIRMLDCIPDDENERIQGCY